MEGLVAELVDGARAEMARVAELGGAVEAVDYMKSSLVESHRERWRRIESGDLTVVGMNRFTSTEPSPLTADADGGILVVDPEVEEQRRAALEQWRASATRPRSTAALAELARVAARRRARTSCRRRSPPPGPAPPPASGRRRCATCSANTAPRPASARPRQCPARTWPSCGTRWSACRRCSGRRLKFLVGKPGLDGHSNGAEQIAVRARDAGMDVVYEGIRLTPSQIASSAAQEGVHVIGLSILSGSHAELIPAVLQALRDAGVRRRAGRRRRHHPRSRRRRPARSGRRRRLHPQGLGLNRMIATSSRSSPSAPASTPPRPPERRGGPGRRPGRELGERLRDGDLSAAPAVLNLVETADARRPRADRASCWPPSPRRRSAARRRRTIVGVTGPPGVGKSSLLSRLVAGWRARERSVAVLAVDPSSRRSGGSLLGDRARIERDPADRAVFIRSTAAGDRLGGLAPATRAAAAALAVAFDVVVIETVGVGQSETEVADVADAVAVVVQPGSGDVLQFLKSGIMEIPDVLVVTKADLGRVAHARARRTCAPRCARSGARHRGGGRLLGGPGRPASTSWSTRWTPTGTGWTCRAADAAAAARMRWRTSPPSTASAALRALGGRREAERWLRPRIRPPT